MTADPKATPMPFDADAVRKLADILVDTGLTEIEVSAGDVRIRVARQAPIVQAAIAPLPPAATLPAAAPVAPAETDAVHPGTVTSPMVGVAYLSSEPGSAPYVTQGQQVAAGQTLLLIEAMKTFNQIKAPTSGTVTRILVASGQPVEYGEALVVVE